MEGPRLSGQRSSEQTSGRLGEAAAAAAGAGGHSRAQPQAGPAAARQPLPAGDRAGGGGSRSVRLSGEASFGSSNSNGPRLTEALLADLETQQKLHARKEKLDVHGGISSAPLLSHTCHIATFLALLLHCGALCRGSVC